MIQDARERLARRLMWVRWIIIAGAVLGLTPLVSTDLVNLGAWR